MTTTNNNDFAELNEMRAQLELLHKKLSTQEVLNERLMRQAMSNKYAKIDRKQRGWMVIGTLAIPYILWVFHEFTHISWIFSLYTVTYLLLAIAATYRNTRLLCPRHFAQDDMRTLATRILRLRKHDRQWKMTGWPLCFIWLVWFFYEISYYDGTFHASPFMYGGIVGAVIGLICGFIYMHSYNKTLRQLEQEIQDFIREEEG